MKFKNNLKLLNEVVSG